MSTYEILGTAGQAIAAVIIAAFGEWSLALQTWFILVALDFGTGMLKGLLCKNGPGISSKLSAQGIAKKGMHLLVIAMFFTLGEWMGGIGMEVRSMVIGMFIVHEAVSIMENVVAVEKSDAGFSLPPGVVRLFENMFEKDLEGVSNDS